jgi:hypothetical protein
MITQRFLQWKSANLRQWRTLRRLGIAGGALAAVALGFASWPTALAQTAGGRAQPLITQAVNDGSLVALVGNTRPEAKNPANDRGRVDDATPMPHLMLQLRRPAAQEQALATLIDQLHDKNSPNYHHWLTANQIGEQFGPAASDISTVTNWLTQHGFTVNTVYPNGMAIEFSGTAGQIRSAFHTEIHHLLVNGVAHFANTTDPQIPAALAPLVAGIVSLNDFRPHPQAVHQPQATGEFTKSGYFYMSPPDLATIYNFNQAFNGGITGNGQTIYLLEDSDIYTDGGTINDWTTFRTGFGIPVANYPGASLTTIHPGCTDPGVNGDDAEAIIDAEYASAAAPGAAIVMAVCDDFVGMLQTMFNNQNTYPPSVISISYGECEALNGASNNLAFRNVYQTGVAEGWSIFVSAGDQGAGGCNYGGHTVTDGVGVSGFASTPYNVAVGGTDFGDTFAGQNNTYWSSTNTATFGSALSYIPEIPWNTTCGSQLFATSKGFATTYGTSGFCNGSFVANYQMGFYLKNWAGSGGQSLCAQGSASVPGVISGTCTGWPKPSWQSGFLGNPADTVRDLPDVSMFASFGPWHHAYAICYSDTTPTGNPPEPRNGTGIPCDGTANAWSTGWGGTSFGSPIWAGIQALVNQYTGSTQGNPNPVLYQLAAAEYGTSGSSACNSSNGNTVSGSCIFYDVTAGDMVAPCTNYSCYLPSGTYGVMSTNPSAYSPAFATGLGWDFATGIGTVNVYNLITNWASLGGGNAGLTVGVTGGGRVTSSPTGINCPSICGYDFTGGSQVTLTPSPNSGWAFSSWGGACSSSGGCTVTMNAAESVTATFVQDVTLSVSVTGSGSVTSSPPGINCPSTCSESVAPGTQVTLTATPVNGWGFSGWGGACSGVGNCVVTMSTAQSVTATFAQTQYTLNVSVAGSGTVSSSPTGISCPSTCTMNYSSGTPVTLTATPSGGATFNSWGGACSGNGSCVVTMNSIESVTAMFSSSGGGGPSSQTFVSATLGNDSNPCTRMSPCATFAAALAQTTASGEIDVLDPGDFGPVTITKAVSIYSDAFGAAGLMPSSGTSGIVVSAGSSDVISLRGLIFDGVNASGTSGVVFLSGERLNISKCVFQGFTTSGMTLSPGTGSAPTTLLVVQDTTVLNNATGLLIRPTGGIAANVTLRWLRTDNNTGEGLRIDGTGGSGMITATLADSTASFNASNGVDAVSGPGNVTLDIMRVVAALNGSAGIQSNQSSGGTASVTLGNSMLHANAIGIQATGGAGLLSYGNNQVTRNATNGSFTGTAGFQ